MNYELTDHILSHIHRISTLLTEPSSVDRVLKVIMETVKKDLNFNRCSVYLVNKNNKKLECKYITGFSPEKEKFVMQRPFDMIKHDCIETKVIFSGKPILVKEFCSDPVVTELDKRVTDRMGRGCTLYVPLKIKSDIIGILGVDKKHNEPEINEKELESLSIFANYASIIIEKSRLVEELLNEKKFSENVLKSSIDGILTVDVIGRITSVNPAAEEMFDIDRLDAMNKFMGDIFESSEWKKRISKTIKQHINIKGWEYNITKSSNQDIILNISTSQIMNEEGGLIGFMFLIRDITNERRRDEYLQRMTRLISLGELAAGVAHEIRNPLTGIGVVLDMLRGKKRLSKVDCDLINQANGEIERLENLIADLLVFANPRQLNYEPVEINDILKSISSLISEQCNKQKIELTGKFCDKLPVTYVDRERIRQGFLNIVINAIQAMPEDGRLTIETNFYRQESTPVKSQYIMITISDTGIGISNAHKDRIFDPFFTTHSDGTGLGLSITHSIIKEHHGSIRVDSEQGKGTKFTILLPQDCRKTSCENLCIL
jgi:PAS domain S-box-containing protein